MHLFGHLFTPVNFGCLTRPLSAAGKFSFNKLHKYEVEDNIKLSMKLAQSDYVSPISFT
jgi:hypothetical protein